MAMVMLMVVMVMVMVAMMTYVRGCARVPSQADPARVPALPAKIGIVHVLVAALAAM